MKVKVKVKASRLHEPMVAPRMHEKVLSTFVFFFFFNSNTIKIQSFYARYKVTGRQTYGPPSL